MRADVYLTAAGYTQSRKKAQDLIAAGAVTIDGVIIKKPSASVNEAVEHDVVLTEVFPYVSRGGVKLQAALDTFGINVNGKKAVDIGASTGGFTDCLLKRGAKKVYSVDSGIGQLHESLRSDSRVVCIEHFNARELTAEQTDGACEVAVTDVSFISQTYIIPSVGAVLEENGIFISLIKPQFEAGRQGIGKNGIVTNSAYRFLSAKRVISCAVENGFDCVGFMRSPIDGGDGNKEYIAFFIKKPCVKPAVDDNTVKGITAV